MKKIKRVLGFGSLFLLLTGFFISASAQTTTDQQAFQNGTFEGAKADKAEYKVIYQLNNDDPKIIQMTLRNMKNALEDPRLKGKLQVELVAFSGGVTVFRKDQPYEQQLRDLKDKGVILAQCLNTLKERKIPKTDLFDFISYVPSGNGELIIRQAQGWALVHP